MNDEPVLILYSCGLLSKWGFDDGDTPDAVYDYFDKLGLTSSPDGYLTEIPWHTILRQLVHSYLLPALDQDVKVIEISTIHNPVRAETVDGVNVRDCWYTPGRGPHLTPESVAIPMSKVAALVPH